MKKLTGTIFAICLATALVGCGGQEEIQNPVTENTEQETTQITQTEATEETETIEETEATEETLAHNTGEAELDFSDFE